MSISVKNMPVKYKLILSVYILLLIIVSVSFAFIINQEINHRHNELVVEARAFNELLSQDFVAVIAIGGVDEAADITSRLRALNKIQGLTIYNKNQQPVFYYKKKNTEKFMNLPEGWQIQHEFIDGSLLMFDALKYHGNEYGYIFIQLSAKEINESINDKLLQAAVILLVLLLVLLVFSWFVQKYFSNPIQMLAMELRKAAMTQDFSVRLPNNRQDEIGDLFKGFNDLQNKIEEEKKALQDQQFAFDQHCIVAITDINGTITYANDLFVKISGYSKEELIGKNHRIINSSFHSRDFFKDMYQTISAGNVWHGDICNKAKDGSEYWVATTIVPLIGENGKPLSYLAMRTDITVQNNAEANLLRAQKMAHIGSWELDLIKNNINWSAEVYRIFEINPDGFTATYEAFIDAVHPDDREMVNNAYTESLKTRRPYELEHRLQMKDGRIKIVNEQCDTYFDEAGKPLRSVGVVQDITQYKHTEEALRRSQKMEAVGQLTGGIAHDFNNIMGIILGNVELLELMEISDEKILNRIDPIKKSAKRAAKLTKQLLSFSRRKANQLTVTNINQLLDGMNTLIDHSITPEIEVEYKFTHDLWLTKIDPGDFQDAILNIIINARDAMNNSGRLVIESLNCHLDEKFCALNPGVIKGDYVQVNISDNGKGMTLKQQQHIFEPFYTTKEEGSGTGLGLAMVFGFIERSKGSIKVESETGMGTTFRIYLPRVDEKIEIKTGLDKKASKALPKGDETLLVVDDEEGLRDFAGDILRALGYTVFVCSDGKQALELLEQNPSIDLLFSDVVMPGGINGYELAGLAEKKYPDLKILLTSGYTQNAGEKNDQAQITANLLRKPYTRKELANRLRDILD